MSKTMVLYMRYITLCIHLIPNLPLFECSFVYLQISPCCLVLKLEMSKEHISLNEAARASLQVKKKILKWWPFWNKVYISLPSSAKTTT